MLSLKLFKLIFEIFLSSILTEPLSQSYVLEISSRIVDLPLPVFPIIASVFPSSISKVIPFNASILVSS